MKDPKDSHLTERLHPSPGKGDPFAAAVRATRIAMLITDPRKPDNPIVFANDAFLELTGYAREEVLGRNCRFLQGPDTDPETVATIRDAIAQRTSVSAEILNYRKDGSPFWNAMYISPVMDDAGELLWFFGSQVDVTERRERELHAMAEKERFERAVAERTRELKAALDAQTLLLHELDHRVKNNLQMITAMIMLQTRSIADETARLSLDEMRRRVEALATVHRRLYQSEDVNHFDVSAFARDLVSDLVMATGRTDIAVRLNLEPVEVSADKASPLALMVNELVTNALQHAFIEDRPGTIGITISRLNEHFRIVVEDDGVARPGAELGPGSFGRTLVEALARQLKATATWDTAAPGTRVEIDLPVEQLARGE